MLTSKQHRSRQYWTKVHHKSRTGGRKVHLVLQTTWPTARPYLQRFFMRSKTRHVKKWRLKATCYVTFGIDKLRAIILRINAEYVAYLNIPLWKCVSCTIRFHEEVCYFPIYIRGSTCHFPIYISRTGLISRDALSWILPISITEQENAPVLNAQQISLKPEHWKTDT